MGSFDYTCSISELGVSPGDPVLLIALAPSQQGLNGGAFALYEMAIPPIRGIYDDYGRVAELDITPLHQAYALRMGYTDANSMTEALQEGRLTFERGGQQIHARACMSLVEAWDAMLGMPDTSFNSGGLASDLLGRAAEQGAQALAAIPAHLASLDIKPIADGIAEGTYDDERLALMLLNAHIMEHVDRASPFGSLIAPRLGYEKSGHGLFCASSFLTAVALDMPKQGASNIDIETALLLYAETIQVARSMHGLRKIWTPRDSGGSQWSENALHWLWARQLGAIAERKIDWTGNEDEGYLSGFAQARALREREALSGATLPSSTTAQGRPCKL